MISPFGKQTNKRRARIVNKRLAGNVRVLQGFDVIRLGRTETELER